MVIDKKKLFISSVQSEFQEERRALVAYIRQDAMLSRYFDPYLFEESPAQDCSVQRAYLEEVVASIFIWGSMVNDMATKMRKAFRLLSVSTIWQRGTIYTE